MSPAAKTRPRKRPSEMIQFKLRYTCDHCRCADEFWVDRFSQVPAMASRATNGAYSGVRPKDLVTADEMCGTKRMMVLLCKDCCSKFKGRFNYAPTVY